MTVTRLPGIYFDAGFQPVVADAIVLSYADPAPSSTGHPPTKSIILEVADISSAVSRPLRSTTKVWINGVLAVDRGGAPIFKPGFDGPGSVFAFALSPGSLAVDVHQITIDPTTAFDSEEVVEVRVFAESTFGYSLDQTYEFTIADVDAPVVDDVSAVEPKRVRVTFNESVLMDTSSGGALNPDNYSWAVETTPAWTPDTWTVEQVSSYEVDLVLEQELSHDQTYELTVENIEDTSGNPMVPQAVLFTGGELQDPDRDFDLWSKIPLKIRQADQALTGGSPGDTEKLIGIFQDVADLLWNDVDLACRLYDIDLAPMDSIELLLEQFGNPFALDLDDNQKRKLLRNLVYIYREKGTEVGIINAIFFFLGIPVTITTLLARSWRLGYDKLGISTRLGPSDSAARFTFWVIVPVALTDAERKAMDDIIKIMKAAHEHHVIVEPTPPPPATWRLGYHKLGTETRLGG